jgi:hypothetical protein
MNTYTELLAENQLSELEISMNEAINFKSTMNGLQEIGNSIKKLSKLKELIKEFGYFTKFTPSRNEHTTYQQMRKELSYLIADVKKICDGIISDFGQIKPVVQIKDLLANISHTIQVMYKKNTDRIAKA